MEGWPSILGISKLLTPSTFAIKLYKTSPHQKKKKTYYVL